MGPIWALKSARSCSPGQSIGRAGGFSDRMQLLLLTLLFLSWFFCRRLTATKGCFDLYKQKQFGRRLRSKPLHSHKARRRYLPGLLPLSLGESNESVYLLQLPGGAALPLRGSSFSNILSGYEYCMGLGLGLGYLQRYRTRCNLGIVNRKQDIQNDSANTLCSIERGATSLFQCGVQIQFTESACLAAF